MNAADILSGREWDGENLLGVVLEKVRAVMGRTGGHEGASLALNVEAMELGDAFREYEGPERLFPPDSGPSSGVAKLGSSDLLAAGYVPYGEDTARDLTRRMDEAGRERTEGRASERGRPGWRGRTGFGHAQRAFERRCRSRFATQEDRANHSLYATDAHVRRMRCADQSWSEDEIRQ